MKIYILYENPYDEGDNIFGVFSTEEKVNEAYKIFSPVNDHQLYIKDFELDDLERFYEEAQSGYRWYIGNMPKTEWGNQIVYGKWDFHTTGLDSLLEENRKTYVVEFKRYVSAFIRARSEKEAEEIANKILKEKREGYSAWLSG